MVPSVHPEAYVAPTAVLSGEVRVGPGSCVMHGAVLAAEGAGGGGRELRDHGGRGAAGRREQMQAALRRYTAAIARHHRQDEILPDPEDTG